MSYVEAAFHAVCKEAITPDRWYVALMEKHPYYGGPEEGGWWGTDTYVVAFEQFPTEELAREAAEKVEKLAYELGEEAHKEHGEQCLRELDWLEARGLDADWLPEPDGPSEYFVTVSSGIPEERRGCRHYE